LPSSGKTTLARAVRRALPSAVLLDGDEVRSALVPPHGYTALQRERFYKTLANLAALLSWQGQTVLVAATANLRSYRAYAREHAPRFIEVFVDTSPEECTARDAKGLYRAGVKLGHYEVPLRPEVTARSGNSAEAVRACLAALWD
jgi:adenylylsulfate kinase